MSNVSSCTLSTTCQTFGLKPAPEVVGKYAGLASDKLSSDTLNGLHVKETKVPYV